MLTFSLEEFHDERGVKVLRFAAASNQSHFGDVCVCLVCRGPWNVCEAGWEEGKRIARDRITGKRRWAAEGKRGIFGLTLFSSCLTLSSNTLSAQRKQYVSRATSASVSVCSNRFDRTHSPKYTIMDLNAYMRNNASTVVCVACSWEMVQTAAVFFCVGISKERMWETGLRIWSLSLILNGPLPFKLGFILT